MSSRFRFLGRGFFVSLALLFFTSLIVSSCFSCNSSGYDGGCRAPKPHEKYCLDCRVKYQCRYRSSFCRDGEWRCCGYLEVHPPSEPEDYNFWITDCDVLACSNSQPNEEFCISKNTDDDCEWRIADRCSSFGKRECPDSMEHPPPPPEFYDWFERCVYGCEWHKDGEYTECNEYDPWPVDGGDGY